MRVRVVASGFVQAEPDDAHPNTGLTRRFGRGPMESLTRSDGGSNEAMSRNDRACRCRGARARNHRRTAGRRRLRGPRGLPGIITFQRFDENGQFQLWVANADLSTSARSLPGRTPAASPPGSQTTRLAFDSNRSDPDLSDDNFPNDVFTMNPTGPASCRSPTSGRIQRRPGLVSGRQVARLRVRPRRLPSQAGHLRVPPERHPAPPSHHAPRRLRLRRCPAVLSHGKRIVFTRYHLDDQGNETSALHVVNVDGTHETSWTPPPTSTPATRTGHRTGRRSCSIVPVPIFTIRPDGTHLRQLTQERPDGFTASADPVYSPDGHQIMLLPASHEPVRRSSPSGCRSCGRTGSSCATSPTTPRRQPKNISPTGSWRLD